MNSRKTSIQDCRIIELNRRATEVGDLVIGQEDSIGFVPKRVYYLYDVPADAERGGHAHIELEQIIVAVSGSFDLELFDGFATRKITMNQPWIGLKLPPGLWRELKSFSGGAVCLVLASAEYDEEDYLRSFDKFSSWKQLT